MDAPTSLKMLTEQAQTCSAQLTTAVRDQDWQKAIEFSRQLLATGSRIHARLNGIRDALAEMKDL